MIIDFIKFLCEKSEGFDISIDQEGKEYISTIHDSIDLNMSTPLAKNVYFPLLIQRAIEGINKDIGNSWNITQRWNYIECNSDDIQMETFEVWEEDKFDNKKEAALKYIFSQDTTNAN